jgi:hypothetical protein
LEDKRTILDDELRATIECRLVTTGRRSGEPREIRSWFSAAGERVFLLSQDQERAHWVRNVTAEPRVLAKFLREALPVAIDLEREVG